MTSSDAVAAGIYRELDARDRAVVDGWRNLGDDLMTALLRSRVVGSGPRRRAVDYDSLPSRAHFPSDDQVDRETAEHECAHVVAALALGVPVRRAWMPTGDDPVAAMRHAPTTARNHAVILIAPRVWLRQFRTLAYPHLSDDHTFRWDMDELRRVELSEPGGIGDAYGRALRILRDNRATLLGLAEELRVKRELEF